MQFILYLEPCSIIKNLQDNASKDYMLSQTLHKDLSRFSKDWKNIHKPLKNTCGSTLNIIQCKKGETKENDNNKCYKHYETMMIS